MSLLNRITGLFHGRTVEKAAVARRRFEAATANRFNADWVTTQDSIDHELRSDLDKLRARSRDLAKNNDYVRKYLQMVVNNLVGPQGFLLISRVEDTPGVLDQNATQAIENAFWKWMEVAEITGRMGFVDLCRTVAESLARDGEVLIRKVRGKQAGNEYGFALQLIDIDRLDTGYNLAAASGRNAVVMGVEVDEYRRPVFYHIFSAHPSTSGHRTRERVPADEIMHRFVIHNPEQTRGYPWAHAVIHSLHALNEYNKSALIAARKGADTLGFFVSPNGEPPALDGEMDGEPIAVSVPGQYDTLPEGYDFRAYESSYPSASYGDFVTAILRRIATGLGVSYNTLAEDLEGVNYSSIRSGVITERDHWMSLQNWMINALLTPIFREWLRMALFNGAIRLPNGSPLPLSKYDKFVAHNWQARRWQWVDPLKDIEAARLAIQTGIASPQQVAASSGVDIDDVLIELARFESSVEAAKLKTITLGKTDASPIKPKPEE